MATATVVTQEFETNSSNVTNKEDGQVLAINVPVFRESSPSLWFRVVEAQFKVKGISQSRTKFCNALSHLSMEVLENVPTDILDKEDYDELKQSVISSFEQSKPELFEKLIAAAPATGKPSMYLKELQKIARKVNVGDDLVRHKFINSLPSNIAPVAAAQTTLSLTQLGAMVDDLVPYQAQLHHVAAAPSRTFQKQNDGKIANDRNSVSPRNPTIPLGLRPFNSNQRPKICRGHLYFAEKSRTCKPWCKYPNKQGCNIHPSSRSSSPVSERSGN